MNKDKKNIDLLFEEKLHGFKESPSAYAWDRLEHDLNKKKSVKYLYYFRWAAASILILLAFGAGYFYATYTTESSQKISQEMLIPEKASESQLIEKPVELSLESKSGQEDLHAIHQQHESANVSTNNKEKQVDFQTREAIELQEKETDQLIAEINIQDNKTEIDSGEEPKATVEEINEIQITDEKQAIALKQAESLENEGNANYEPLRLDPNAKVYGMEDIKSKDVKWSIGAQFAPVLSYRDISINYENQSATNVKEAESQLNDAEESLLTYAGGIDVNYFLSDRWSIQSGMVYSKIGQVSNNALNFKKDNDQYLLFAIHTSTGNINIAFEKVPGDIRKINPPKDTLEAIDLNNVKIIQNFELFEIPLMIKYKILNKKLGINISGGLSPAYLLSNNIILQVDNDKYDIGNSSNLNSMIVNSSVSLGINYQLSKKLTLNLEPNFKYSLSPINKNSQFDYHPYYFSWFTGINYKL